METKLPQMSPTLYDTDYHLWVLETVKQLENRDFNSVDWNNLIDEVWDLSRREKRRMESLLTLLIEHLLKSTYWESEKPINLADWQAEITNFRKQIKRELKGSPSLNTYLKEIFIECYQDAREIASRRSACSSASLSQLPLSTFPVEPITNLEAILNENWFP
ncbi:DUF29 domain-containing protein [Nodularia spumigena CS-591/12]|uniref:DUF29 domain-containing protein n=1 Tax=Nodularia spumigena TaxID=70799 RepID=UPI00232B4380|nr:DUF29 domain-containing protein [Nodularia spumigena]MDB9306809.1 DUF29 domain-containing protein [Nodularia spumigena CS-591/12]MDB9343917.1 DUF29 domain-containing protein [Nodularia spumigena CS-588/06]MDB9371645.1 DUF29 domain-containing protein [Nodularia spumigena CS-586/05]